MGCEYYDVGDTFIHAAECSEQDDIPCQCTFPGNNIAMGEKLDAAEVASLAMLGATLVLLSKGEIDGPAFWPDCLPAWVIREIRKYTIDKEEDDD